MIRVVKAGLFTTVQDLGRFGYLSQGMPSAGAMDEYALRAANILVGNDDGEACLEMTLLGPWLEFLADGMIALTGADVEAKLNETDIPLWQSIRVSRGDVLKCTAVKRGCRAYLAVAGGIDVPLVMGSRSTYTYAKVGGLEGRALRQEDVLRMGTPAKNFRRRHLCKAPEEYRYEFINPIRVRVVMGPQNQQFSAEGIATFLHSPFQVSDKADRMGYRLEGPVIQHQGGPDIISDGIALGSIQVPGDGRPIIMMTDRQTTGGYTKIATVISPDLNRIAQAKPGDTIEFQEVSVDEARQIYSTFAEKIKTLRRQFDV